MLPHKRSNQIFLLKIPHEITSSRVTYLTSADIGLDLPMIDKNQKIEKYYKTVSS